MGGLFGGGGKKRSSTPNPNPDNKDSNAVIPPETPGTTTNTGTGLAPPAPTATLMTANNVGLNRRRQPSFLVTPTMLDDDYYGPSMTGRNETFG